MAFIVSLWGLCPLTHAFRDGMPKYSVLGFLKVGSYVVCILSLAFCTTVGCNLKLKTPTLLAVYDSGTVFDPSVLDITDDDLRTRFLQVTTSLLSQCYTGSI